MYLFTRPTPKLLQPRVGQYNGYVALDASEVQKLLISLNLDDVSKLENSLPQPHGGVTFLRYVSKYDIDSTLLEDKYLVVGFDTCHFEDTYSYWTKERVEAELQEWSEKIKNILKDG